MYGSVSAKDIAQEITSSGLSVNKSQVILNKTFKSLSYEDVSIKLHPEVNFTFKLNIARSNEEAKEQSKTGKAIITTEITGGDIRSERAQKDAKRFDKKNNTKKINKTAETESKQTEKDGSNNLVKEEIKGKVKKQRIRKINKFINLFFINRLLKMNLRVIQEITLCLKI